MPVLISSTTLPLDARTGLVGRLPFQCNSYVAESDNDGGVAAAHNALGTTDVLVERTSIVDVIDLADAICPKPNVQLNQTKCPGPYDLCFQSFFRP